MTGWVMNLFLLAVRVVFGALADPKPHTHTKPRLGRCTLCGHRLGDNVVETRKLPFWTWPGEILRRFQAIRSHA